MSLERTLAKHALTEYPSRAALVLERIGAGEASGVLEGASPASIAAIAERWSPQYAARALGQLSAQTVARVLESMTLEAAVRLLRRADEAAREKILREVQPARARTMSELVGFPEGSAGSLMDPDVLALPEEFTAGEAMQRIRQVPEHARYNLYVVSQSQRLTGTLNLRELLLAREEERLSEIMVPDPYRLVYSADRTTVLTHPGWKVAHALPVVDEENAYLGAIRYRTLRDLERELIDTRQQDVDTSSAIAEVIGAAAGGLFEAVTGSIRTREGRHDG